MVRGHRAAAVLQLLRPRWEHQPRRRASHLPTFQSCGVAGHHKRGVRARRVGGGGQRTAAEVGGRLHGEADAVRILGAVFRPSRTG